MKSYSMTRFFSSSQKKIKSEAEKNWLIRNEIKQMIMHLHNPFIIFISREYIFRYEFLRLHCPLIVSQWTKPCLSKWMDIYIYISMKINTRTQFIQVWWKKDIHIAVDNGARMCSWLLPDVQIDDSPCPA